MAKAKKKNKKKSSSKNSSQVFMLICVLIVSLIMVEIAVRFTIGRGERFYVLREVSFKLTEVENFAKKVDILCLGGSASQGMGLENIKNRYSELLAADFPGFYVVNASNTGIPLSEVNFYLYKTLKINKISNCIIFSGNNEYLELLNRKEQANYLIFLIRYSLPKIYSLISYCSNTTHNLLNKAYDKFSQANCPHPFAIIKGGGKDSWPYINRFSIFVQNLFYRMRLQELRSIIKAHPETNFIYVIPPINYTHNWQHMQKYDNWEMEMPEDITQVRDILEKHWIHRRFLITPGMQTMIKQNLKNLDNLYVLDLDAYLLKQVNNNPRGTEKFFLDYCHPNNTGHYLLAERLKQIIKAKMELSE
jgi:hypothetical protein